MPENGSTLKPDQIFNIAIKHRWYLIASFCISMIVGMYFAITLPKMYESSTLILVQPQRVPESYVQSIVNTDISDRINSLSNQILSRTNLERLIEDLKLFNGPEYEKMFMEDRVELLRRRVEVEVMTSRRQADAFTISYRGKEPEKVMTVVNTLASYFIDQNLKMRENQAIGTSVFLEDELTARRIRLEKVEESLKEYRKTYMGELPEQLESNLRILDRLQEQLGVQQQRLSEAKIHLASLQSMSADNSIIGRGRTSQDTAQQPAGLDSLHSQLTEMKTRYTERHPDIIRLKEQIAELEAALDRNSDDFHQVAINRMSPEQRTELVEVTREIETLQNDIRNTKEDIKIYTKRIENTPKREQELLSLRRDYQNIQSSYDSLLERKLESEIAVNMERKQKGEQFKILDPAQVSVKPVEPDMRKLFLLFIGLGLGAGGGIVFLLEFLNASFKGPDEVEKELNLPVLGTIPHIIKPSTKKWRRVEFGLSICSVFIALVLLVGFAALSFIGVDTTLSMVDMVLNI